MINAATLKTSLYGLVGWRQNSDSNGTQLQAAEVASSSGLYFNDAHPLLTIDNLLSVAPLHVQNDSGLFSTWLEEKTKAATVQTINRWLDEKVYKRTAKSLIEANKLFRTTGRNDLKDVKTTGRLVGFEIVPRKSRNVKTVIRKIGLQLDANQTLNVKLFSSLSSSAVQNNDCVYDQNGGLQWFDVNWTLEPNGAYYIVYEQDDLTGQSVNGVYDYTWDSKMLYFPTGKYTKCRAFHVQSDASELWDFVNHAYTISTNYGLNLEIDTSCDYTDFIVSQKDLFKTAIQFQVAVNMLRELAYNPNSNINRNIKNISLNEILFEIEGDTQSKKKQGLAYQLTSAINNIQFDQTNIDNDCLTCRRRSVHHKTI
tara:strand:+ start:2033 stop:3139 length:1107 start_codon:yes stop_codon:yes gene_type:complete